MSNTREIKFRAKRIDNGEWVYGYYFANFQTRPLATHVIKDIYGNEYEIDLDTLGQDTGLKDKNGKEIWKGDIVKLEQWEPEVYEVLFNRGGFCFRHSDTDVFYHDAKYIGGGEIIGNIYENPELLK